MTDRECYGKQNRYPDGSFFTHKWTFYWILKFSWCILWWRIKWQHNDIAFCHNHISLTAGTHMYAHIHKHKWRFVIYALTRITTAWSQNALCHGLHRRQIERDRHGIVMKYFLIHRSRIESLCHANSNTFWSHFRVNLVAFYLFSYLLFNYSIWHQIITQYVLYCMYFENQCKYLDYDWWEGIND